MNTKFKVYLLAAAISAIAIIAMIFGMPERVPIHFNYSGEADSWGSKWFYAIFALIPLLELGSHQIYKRKSRNPNVRMNAELEEKVVALTGLFLAAVGWFFVLMVRSGETRLNTSFACLIFTGVGLLMIYVSNFMAKIRPNHTLGFRLSWTLKDETVWVKTHRIAGYTGVIGGVIIIVGSLLGMAFADWLAFAGFGLGMVVMVATPAMYARNLYNQLHPNKE
jgi:uncharacterized membrane protein